MTSEKPFGAGAQGEAENPPEGPESPESTDSAATPEELRERVEHSRRELAHTVESLAARVDVKSRARHRAADLRERARRKAALLSTQVRGKAAHAAHVVRDKTPEPVRDGATRTAARIRDRTSGGGHPAHDVTPQPVREIATPQRARDGVLPQPAREKAARATRVLRDHRSALLAAAGALLALRLARRSRTGRR